VTGPAPGVVAAVDLGASSGRVIVGRVGPRTLEVDEVHRFSNAPIDLPDGLHWDVLRLFGEIVDGLRRANRAAPDLASVGIDAWAVDFGLIDADGRLLGNPYHYRDARSARGVGATRAAISTERLYELTGTQFLPFNTIHQLAAARGTPELEAAASALLIPDLIAFWLTERRVAETTNASTTGLLDARRRIWSEEIVAALGLRAAILPPLVQPGEPLGPLRTAMRSAVGAGVEVTAVGSHDTASAVVATPLADGDAAYISCGTWALVGVELEAPILTAASRAANFTNEAGVDGTVRFLRNVAGLWLLQESLAAWERDGTPSELGPLLAAAADLPAGGPQVDPDDPVFLPPGDMPARLVDACRRAGQPIPTSRPALVRCVLDSLAAAFGRAIEDAVRLSGREVRTVHLVGGGSRNHVLCQLTADVTGRPVVAGPVEATSIGNLLVQARARGFVQGDLAGLRALVAATHPLRRFEPRIAPAGLPS
jgi:rhamnulokinase